MLLDLFVFFLFCFLYVDYFFFFFFFFQAEDGIRDKLVTGVQTCALPIFAQHEGAVAGFALWFLNYSTWLGRHGVWLEDLYVTPMLRGAGLGRALLAELARICVRQGYGRLDWWVLDWNSAARGFYESLGAVAMEDWTVHRLTGPALRALADSATGPAS